MSEWREIWRYHRPRKGWGPPRMARIGGVHRIQCTNGSCCGIAVSGDCVSGRVVGAVRVEFKPIFWSIRGQYRGFRGHKGLRRWRVGQSRRPVPSSLAGGNGKLGVCLTSQIKDSVGYPAVTRAHKSVFRWWAHGAAGAQAYPHYCGRWDDFTAAAVARGGLACGSDDRRALGPTLSPCEKNFHFRVAHT